LVGLNILKNKIHSGDGVRFNRLDLNLLVALDALLAERNITRAAERLHLSQSATSGVLARLRGYFEDELLVQVGRKMEPTLLALRLAGPVRDIILKVQATLAIKSDFDLATTAQHFRICASDYMVTVLLNRVLQAKDRQAPHVTLELIAQTRSPGDVLKRGELDFLVIPDRFLADDQPYEVLFEDSYTCVAWAGNEQIGDTLDFDQYMQLGHITPRFGRARQPTLEDWFMKQYGLVRRIDVVTYDFTSMAQLLVGTSLIATMQSQLAKRYAAYLPLRLIPLPLEIPVLRECLQWPRYLEDDPGHQWMRQLFRQAAAELAGGLPAVPSVPPESGAAGD